MKESLFRRLLNSLLDRGERASAMAKIAAVVAGLTACALALAPVLESGAPMQGSPGAVSGAEPGAASRTDAAATPQAIYAQVGVDLRSP